MPDEAIPNFGKQVQLNRTGQPAELATAYVILADPLSSYTSGTTVAVTGASLSFEMAVIKRLVTPVGRHFIVKGKLWRLSNPDIGLRDKARLVKALMDARRAVRDAKNAGDREAELDAHKQVDEAKRSLGERGPVWWTTALPT